MALRIGDEVPNFSADTTEGRIEFHDWIGDGWAILFSHPKNFTPVCTTELGYMAGLKPEFDKRNCKIVGLSVDSVEDPSDMLLFVQRRDYYRHRGGWGGRMLLVLEILRSVDVVELRERCQLQAM